jgi:glutamate racemase
MINEYGKIAVFDSGIGGISFLHTAKNLLPKENFIFYGDLANAPYGEKKPEFIEKRVSEIFDFFIENQAKIIIIACNTATSAAVKYLRAKYSQIDILGMEPAIKPAVDSGAKKVIILSTPITANAPNTLRLIKDNQNKTNIINIPCKGLMELIENTQQLTEGENLKLITNYLTEKLNPVVTKEEEYAIVLGCTHYIFLRDVLHQMYPNVKLYDGNQGTAKNLIVHLKEQNLLNPGQVTGKIEFFSSIDNSIFSAKALTFMEKMAKMQYISPK